ncbi:eukaryotic translation initiation factor 5-like [Symsagittifera roscoffensis]|uniref:eukaryotic translation initiation factor 5-like n=1 Tax=Symsagittifera roscoffensis TaxID=84072 RepID=UPI00307CC7D8
MSGMVNVNSEVTDSFYRYKMPRILAKVEGKGNGIKTVIVNMVDIAKALSRPPAYPCKYFGCELGAQTQIDAKKERYIVNGSHDGSRLQELLDGFIKKFVLCPECDNPETTLLPNQKKKIIPQKCMACGYTNATVDMTHKVCTYILNHPPEMSESAAKNYASKKKRGGDENGDDEGLDMGDDDELEEVIPTGNGTANGADDREFDDWSEDTSADAVAKRQQDLSMGVKGLTITVELEKTPLERQELFYNFMEEKKREGKLDDLAVAKEVYEKAMELDINDTAPLIMVGVIFTENVLKEMPLYKNLFLRFLHVKDIKDGARPNERAQKQLLGGLEKLIEAHKDQLISKVQNMLYVAYDNGLISEEVVIEWSKKATKKFVSRELSKEIRAKAAPFVEWLQNAEEDSDEEDEDGEGNEDDGDIEFSTSTTTRAAAAPTSNGASAGAAQNEEDDDLDIDDI